MNKEEYSQKDKENMKKRLNELKILKKDYLRKIKLIEAEKKIIYGMVKKWKLMN